MIQTLFFPEKIDSYYLFKKKIVGVQICQDKISATVLVAQARTLTITKSFSIDMTHEKGSIQEKTVAALEKLVSAVGSYDSLVVSLSSSYVMFKEQYFPFLQKEKIALVLPFEIEPFLPFPLSEALFDFCITKSYPEKKGSDVIIAALQKKHLAEYTQNFIKAGLVPSSVTVDMLTIYGLYRSTSYFTQENHVLVSFDGTFINIAYLQEGNLKTVRTLVRQESKEEKFWQELFFTLQSFFQEFGQAQKIVFMTDDVSIIEHAQKTISVPCQHFVLHSCLTQLGLTLDPSVSETSLSLFSLAAAYPSIFTTDFSLATELTQQQEKQTFRKQATIALSITLVIVCAMLTHTIIQVHKLSSTLDTTRQGVLKELRKSFPTIKSGNLTEAMKNAKKSVAKEEEIWFSFSNQKRRSFLKYLYDLSTSIEREEIGLQLKKMVLTKDSLVLEGNVRSRDFIALAQFEQELKSTELFVRVPEFQKTEFTETLIFKPQRGTV